MIEKITPVFAGRILTLNIERVRLPNGHTADLEIAHHPGGAAVVAIDADARVCLLRQYRHAAGGWLLELPAGKIDNQEPPIDTARRELAEEAGREASCWVPLGAYMSSPGVLTETIHLYLATGLSEVDAMPEAHEVFEARWIALPEAVRMAHDGRIRDGKTLVGLLRAAGHCGSGI